jgi:N,N'-diacetyllegionaminate synthase
MEFIAEIGLNHNGNFGLAYELIRQAKYAGASIVKFQLGWKSGEGQINNIDHETLSNLKKWSDHFEIELMFSIFTEDAFTLIKQFEFSRYKIASRTVKDHPDLVKRILDEGKTTYISLGMWEKSELPFSEYDNVKYLWCKSKYPSLAWDLLDLPKDFNSSPYYGYSDHSIGIEVPLITITRGAKIIEKHFTLDKSDTTIRDHALSADPDEFRSLVLIGTEISKVIAMGV